MTDTEADLLAEVLLLRHSHQTMHRRAQRAESEYRRQSLRFGARLGEAVSLAIERQRHQELESNSQLAALLRDAEMELGDAREWAIYLSAFVAADVLEGLEIPDWLPERTKVAT